MKHTPGPWTAKGLHIMGEGKIGSIGQAFVMSFKHDIRGRRLPDTEGEANAKLMAAAPTLLKALEMIKDTTTELNVLNITLAALQLINSKT